MDYTIPTNPCPTSSLESYLFSGVNLYVVKEGDTLQTIAQRQLGNINLWPYIAAVNQTIYSNEDLVVGDNIYLPVNVETGKVSKDNFILTEDTLRDPYGTDIKLDKNGNIVLRESNDVALISGVPNVLQAIDFQLRTVAGSMVTQTAYGLTAQPGLAGTAHAISYVKMNFIDALIRDPRVAQVKNVRVEIDRDAIHCGADIYLVGREGTLPIDVVLD